MHIQQSGTLTVKNRTTPPAIPDGFGKTIAGGGIEFLARLHNCRERTARFNRIRAASTGKKKGCGAASRVCKDSMLTAQGVDAWQRGRIIAVYRPTRERREGAITQFRDKEEVVGIRGVERCLVHAPACWRSA